MRLCTRCLRQIDTNGHQSLAAVRGRCKDNAWGWACKVFLILVGLLSFMIYSSDFDRETKSWTSPLGVLLLLLAAADPSRHVGFGFLEYLCQMHHVQQVMVSCILGGQA